MEQKLGTLEGTVFRQKRMADVAAARDGVKGLFSKFTNVNIPNLSSVGAYPTAVFSGGQGGAEQPG